jgi:hypothetical protein
MAEVLNLKSPDQTRRRSVITVMGVLLAALLIGAAKTAYDYTDAPLKDALADAKVDQYYAEHPGPFCTFEGVWHDWERDETMTLGCLEIKGNHLRQGSYKSETGPRATSNFSVTGTYDVGSDSCIRVIGKDRQGKTVRSTTLIAVEDLEYPTQIVSVDEDGEPGFFIWKRKE